MKSLWRVVINSLNGKHQFTFISPERVVSEDGSEIIRVTSNTVDLDEEMVSAAGLEHLATNAGNILQHAEAWTKDEFESTAVLLKEDGDIAFTSHPTDVKPGQSYLNVLSENSAFAEEDIVSFEEPDRGVVLQGGSFDFRDGAQGFKVNMRIESSEKLSLSDHEISAIASTFETTGGFHIHSRSE